MRYDTRDSKGRAPNIPVDLYIFFHQLPVSELREVWRAPTIAPMTPDCMKTAVVYFAVSFGSYAGGSADGEDMVVAVRGILM